jgi:hypothetical protein
MPSEKNYIHIQAMHAPLHLLFALAKWRPLNASLLGPNRWQTEEARSGLYCAESLWCISAPGTPPAHKKRITACCSSLLHKECGAVMLNLPRWPYNWPIKVESISQSRRAFMLSPARKRISAANTTGFKLNHCRIFLTYLRKYSIYDISFSKF